MRDRKALRIAKYGYIVMALVFCLLGLFLIIRPDSSARIICITLGTIFVAYGIVKIIGYFSKDLYNLAFQFDLAFGILMTAVGVLMLIRGEVIIRLLFAVSGVLILADALFRVQMSLDARRFGLKLWKRILVAAVLTGVLGTLLLTEPYGSARMMMKLAGGAFLMEGILSLCVAVYTVKIRKMHTEL